MASGEEKQRVKKKKKKSEREKGLKIVGERTPSPAPPNPSNGQSGQQQGSSQPLPPMTKSEMLREQRRRARQSASAEPDKALAEVSDEDCEFWLVLVDEENQHGGKDGQMSSGHGKKSARSKNRKPSAEMMNSYDYNSSDLVEEEYEVGAGVVDVGDGAGAGAGRGREGRRRTDDGVLDLDSLFPGMETNFFHEVYRYTLDTLYSVTISIHPSELNLFVFSLTSKGQRFLFVCTNVDFATLVLCSRSSLFGYFFFIIFFLLLSFIYTELDHHHHH
jgi:hypothetical protein